MLETLRLILIQRAIAARKRTFLEHAEWREIPWSLDASLSQIHDFIDMFTELPGLMDDALSTYLESSGESDDARIQEGTRRKLGGLVVRLEKWLDA
jgi:hypothetical protein